MRKYTEIDTEKNFNVGMKITYFMSKKGLTQTEIGRRHNATYQAISYVQWGERVSERLRLAIASELGFESWDDLVNFKVVL